MKNKFMHVMVPFWYALHFRSYKKISNWFQRDTSKIVENMFKYLRRIKYIFHKYRGVSFELIAIVNSMTMENDLKEF